MWTMNFQMFKLDLEKAEEPDIKLPTSVGSSKKQESSRKTSTALLTIPKPLTVWITINCGKFLKRWEYQTTLPASWEIYADQEATVRIRHATTNWLQIGKGVHQGYILSPYLLNLYAEYIIRNAGLEEAQAGIKIAGRNINNLRYADGTTLMAQSEEELKSLLMKVKSESEVTQSCPTVRDPKDCSLPDSSIHRIFQARVLEWVAIAFSELSDWTTTNLHIWGCWYFSWIPACDSSSLAFQMTYSAHKLNKQGDNI